MSKNIYTPRDELVCGKIEALDEVIRSLVGVGSEAKIDIINALRDIQYDCQRMEAKLILRKQEVEMHIKQSIINGDKVTYKECFGDKELTFIGMATDLAYKNDCVVMCDDKCVPVVYSGLDKVKQL